MPPIYQDKKTSRLMKDIICGCGHSLSLHTINRESLKEIERIRCVPECDCRTPIFTWNEMLANEERKDVTNAINNQFEIF